MKHLTKCFLLFSFICSGYLAAAETERSENNGRGDDYTLYDRNKAGLDWNRYSYPSARQPEER